VGGELAGYGHVGRDAGPGDSDCWGCHGFAFDNVAAAQEPRPLIPTVFDTDQAVITAGTETTLLVAGAALTNTDGGVDFTSDIELTDTKGSSIVLAPDIIFDQGMLAVTIPGTTAVGNYRLRAVNEEFASNPTVVSVVPKPRIYRASGIDGTVAIRGSGLGGYAKRSGTAVRGRFTTVLRGRVTTRYVNGTIAFWDDTRVVVRFASTPNRVTIRTVFGNATSAVRAVSW
jgi:hypothetical protein